MPTSSCWCHRPIPIPCLFRLHRLAAIASSRLLLNRESVTRFSTRILLRTPIGAILAVLLWGMVRFGRLLIRPWEANDSIVCKFSELSDEVLRQRRGSAAGGRKGWSAQL